MPIKDVLFFFYGNVLPAFGMEGNSPGLTRVLMGPFWLQDRMITFRDILRG